MSERKIKTRWDRQRVSFQTKGPSRTDISFREQTNINQIIARARQTGVLPQPNLERGFYGDVSNLPSGTLLEAFERVQTAQSLFMDLPSEVRRSMHNDPARLEDWLRDPENRDVAVRHGLLQEQNKADLSAQKKQGEATPPP